MRVCFKIDRPMPCLNWLGKEMGQFAFVQTMVNMFLPSDLVTCMQILTLLMMPANTSFIL